MKRYWLSLMLILVFTEAVAMSSSQPEYVEVAKYGIMESWTEANDLGVRWEEPRDIYKVAIKYADETKMPGVAKQELQYWQHHWPEHRIAKGQVAGAGGSGWMPQDDWTNGNWKTADSNIQIEGNTWTYSFKPINAREFPHLEDFEATFRKTLKLRVLFDEPKPEIIGFYAYTDSVWRQDEVNIEWGCDTNKEEVWDGHLMVYNGEVEKIAPLRSDGQVEVLPDMHWKSTVHNRTDGIKATIRYAYNEDINSYDKTIVTVRTQCRSFSFLMDDLEAGEGIYIKDFGVLVTRASDGIDYQRFKKKWDREAGKTFYERIKELPEQTHERAWKDMPPKHQFYIVLGCEGGRQKFAVEPNGDVSCSKNWITRLKGKDTDKLLWEGYTIRYSFGFPQVKPTERYIEGGYLPIIHTKWKSDNLVYEQVAFATLLGKDILSGRMAGDDTVVLLVKINITNSTKDGKKATLSISSSDDNGSEILREKGGFIFATRTIERYEKERLRLFVDIHKKGTLKLADGKLVYELALKPGKSHSIYVKIPFITLTESGEFDLLRQIDYGKEKPKVTNYWQARVTKGTQITTPDATLNNFYRAHLIHMLITNDREAGSDRYMARVGSLNYGVYPNEGCMCISDLDRRGYNEEAEKHLETFIHYQGTEALPGNFSSIDGIYYGAGGYENGGYNQHHGWVLWGLGEHYWYTRDKKWLIRVAPSIIKGCDWIIRERKGTMKYDKKGNKVLEYGFLPAGALEDVQEYWYWLCTNAYSYLGLKNAAYALADIGHPEANRLVKEAQNYKEDLLNGFREAMIRSPVVKLRDGTYVPHFPSRLYRRGREFGWIRETLEGAIHLIRCGLLEPWDEESTWIIKDYEDNLYLSERYGYRVPDLERYWFSRGGFSMQPNLLCNPIPYLQRDEPKHFLRAYFNAFAVAFYPDTCLLTEHPLPTIADWAGDHYKTSDEAQSTYWLRLMLIQEKGKDLYLAMATPREWLKDGKKIKVERAATYFGELGFEIRSQAAKGEISLILELPKRNPPDSVYVRVRHPNEKRLKKVTINGKPWKDFFPDKELIQLSGLKGKVDLVAYY